VRIDGGNRRDVKRGKERARDEWIAVDDDDGGGGGGGGGDGHGLQEFSDLYL
jgi:hypothetical protein